MLLEESKWIGEKVISLTEKGYLNILNIGSSTNEFRKVIKPYIYENIFQPLEKTAASVVHSDIKEGDGVDLIGDLYDPNFLEKLKNNRYDVVICSNLLEHLENRQTVCDALVEIVRSKGFLIVTVPYKYPYHFDPIDTMYRPNTLELAKAFSGTTLVEGSIIDDSKTYANKLREDKRLALIIFLRSFLPFYKPRMWWNTVSYLPNILKNFQTTCVLLQKTD